MKRWTSLQLKDLYLNFQTHTLSLKWLDICGAGLDPDGIPTAHQNIKKRIKIVFKEVFQFF